jgi:transcriptional regulator with XRE-family HTH domain
MRQLIRRLRNATEKRGMKAKLARAMGVPLQRVSEWLGSVKEPSGKTTFKLLQWVRQQEGQQESPGSAQTPPEPKTRSTQISHEKRKSNPPKG